MPGSSCQHWFRLWLGVVRHQAITWASVDQNLSRHMASLRSNELICLNNKNVTQVTVTKYGRHAPSHYLIYLKWCWIIVNLTIMNKLQWNSNQNWNIFIQSTALENVICKVSIMLGLDVLTCWPLGDLNTILKTQFSISLYWRGIFKYFDNALRWMSLLFLDDKSTLVQGTAWCHQITTITWVNVVSDLCVHIWRH